MTERSTTQRRLIVVLLVIAPLLCAQTATRERVTPDGPYRSQVRVLEDDRPAGTDTVADNDYARALLLRQRALGHIASGQRREAIAALEQALALDSLAELARAQMQANLGQLYLAEDRAADAARLLAAARAAGVGDARLAIAHASAALDSGAADVAAGAALDALALTAQPPDDWLELAAIAATRAGRHDEAIAQQRRLLARDPALAQRWTTLATLYARAGRERLATATLAAAAAGGIALDTAQREQLAGLLAETGLPDLAAREVAALASQRREARYLGWLARLKFDAHDEPGALAALEDVAQLSGNAADWLQAGEYALATAATARALPALERATRNRADGSTRARALLLLGQTHARAGQVEPARRALLEASEYGGAVYSAATRWLEELPAATTATLPAATPSPVVATTAVVASRIVADVPVKTVPRLRVYSASDATTRSQLVDRAAALVRELVRTSRRERIEWTGPLQVVVAGRLDSDATDAPIDLAVAAPVRRVTPSRGRFRTQELDAFRCAWRRYEGPWDGLDAAWGELYTDILAAGLAPADEARQVVFHRARGAGDSVVELQVGLR